jgi:hypothetical protein
MKYPQLTGWIFWLDRSLLGRNRHEAKEGVVATTALPKDSTD